MSERQKKARDMRLVDQADQANYLAPLLENDAVQAFFAEYERQQVDALAEAEPSDDEKRFDASMKLKAMRSFRSKMESIVATGRRAAEKLEGLDNG